MSTYTNHYQYKKTSTQNYSKYNNVCSYGIILVRDTRTSLKKAVVNEPSVFDASNFYCVSRNIARYLFTQSCTIKSFVKLNVCELLCQKHYLRSVGLLLR